ncbi:MAG: fluoride efflux transporter CrcB [Nitrospira sp.]
MKRTFGLYYESVDPNHSSQQRDFTSGVTQLDYLGTMSVNLVHHFSASCTLRTLFLIGTGGFIGSIFRYLLSGWVQQLSKSVQFPFGTLAVNIVGCALIGFLAQLADQRGVVSGEARTFLMVGILGGFTTFSAFGNETMNLLRDGELWLACGNVVGHTVLGLAAVWAGYSTAYLLWK